MVGSDCNFRVGPKTKRMMLHIMLIMIYIMVYYTEGCGRDCTSCFPRDCRDVQELGFTKSGVYHVIPVGTFSGFDVWCDLETDNGGWLVFQRRQDGSVEFYMGWTDYQRGFGAITAEHWLGNLALHAITSQGLYELRVELEDWSDNKTFAQYDYFRIGSYEDRYRLAVSGYSGNAGDSLGSHDGMAFDTYDIGASGYHNISCPERAHGAWWYQGCHDSNLNGDYHQNGTHKTVSWADFRGHTYALKRTEMKLRRL